MHGNGGVQALTACQVRMARAALRWSVEQLAINSGISEKTIRRIERVYGVPPNVTLDTLHALSRCFAAQGMTFLPEDGSPEGPGVRFGGYPGRVVKLGRDLRRPLDGELLAASSPSSSK